MGDQEVKITSINFINELTGEITLMVKEAEVEDWVLPYARVDRGLWSVYIYSCEETDDDLNGGQG